MRSPRSAPTHVDAAHVSSTFPPPKLVAASSCHQTSFYFVLFLSNTPYLFHSNHIPTALLQDKQRHGEHTADTASCTTSSATCGGDGHGMAASYGTRAAMLDTHLYTNRSHHTVSKNNHPCRVNTECLPSMHSVATDADREHVSCVGDFRDSYSVMEEIPQQTLQSIAFPTVFGATSVSSLAMLPRRRRAHCRAPFSPDLDTRHAGCSTCSRESSAPPSQHQMQPQHNEQVEQDHQQQQKQPQPQQEKQQEQQQVRDNDALAMHCPDPDQRHRRPRTGRRLPWNMRVEAVRSARGTLRYYRLVLTAQLTALINVRAGSMQMRQAAVALVLACPANGTHYRFLLEHWDVLQSMLHRAMHFGLRHWYRFYARPLTSAPGPRHEVLRRIGAQLVCHDEAVQTYRALKQELTMALEMCAPCTALCRPMHAGSSEVGVTLVLPRDTAARRPVFASACHSVPPAAQCSSDATPSESAAPTANGHGASAELASVSAPTSSVARAWGALRQNIRWWTGRRNGSHSSSTHLANAHDHRRQADGCPTGETAAADRGNANGDSLLMPRDGDSTESDTIVHAHTANKPHIAHPVGTPAVRRAGGRGLDVCDSEGHPSPGQTEAELVCTSLQWLCDFSPHFTSALIHGMVTMTEQCQSHDGDKDKDHTYRRNEPDTCNMDKNSNDCVNNNRTTTTTAAHSSIEDNIKRDSILDSRGNTDAACCSRVCTAATHGNACPDAAKADGGGDAPVCASVPSSACSLTSVQTTWNRPDACHAKPNHWYDDRWDAWDEDEDEDEDVYAAYWASIRTTRVCDKPPCVLGKRAEPASVADAVRAHVHHKTSCPSPSSSICASTQSSTAVGTANAEIVGIDCASTAPDFPACALPTHPTCSPCVPSRAIPRHCCSGEGYRLQTQPTSRIFVFTTDETLARHILVVCTFFWGTLSGSRRHTASLLLLHPHEHNAARPSIAVSATAQRRCWMRRTDGTRRARSGSRAGATAQHNSNEVGSRDAQPCTVAQGLPKSPWRTRLGQIHAVAVGARVPGCSGWSTECRRSRGRGNAPHCDDFFSHSDCQLHPDAPHQSCAHPRHRRGSRSKSSSSRSSRSSSHRGCTQRVSGTVGQRGDACEVRAQPTSADCTRTAHAGVHVRSSSCCSSNNHTCAHGDYLDVENDRARDGVEGMDSGVPSTTGVPIQWIAEEYDPQHARALCSSPYSPTRGLLLVQPRALRVDYVERCTHLESTTMVIEQTSAHAASPSHRSAHREHNHHNKNSNNNITNDNCNNVIDTTYDSGGVNIRNSQYGARHSARSATVVRHVAVSSATELTRCFGSAEAPPAVLLRSTPNPFRSIVTRHTCVEPHGVIRTLLHEALGLHHGSAGVVRCTRTLTHMMNWLTAQRRTSRWVRRTHQSGCGDVRVFGGMIAGGVAEGGGAGAVCCDGICADGAPCVHDAATPLPGISSHFWRRCHSLGTPSPNTEKQPSAEGKDGLQDGLGEPGVNEHQQPQQEEPVTAHAKYRLPRQGGAVVGQDSTHRGTDCCSSRSSSVRNNDNVNMNTRRNNNDTSITKHAHADTVQPSRLANSCYHVRQPMHLPALRALSERLNLFTDSIAPSISAVTSPQPQLHSLHTVPAQTPVSLRSRPVLCKPPRKDWTGGTFCSSCNSRNNNNTPSSSLSLTTRASVRTLDDDSEGMLLLPGSGQRPGASEAGRSTRCLLLNATGLLVSPKVFFTPVPMTMTQQRRSVQG